MIAGQLRRFMNLCAVALACAASAGAQVAVESTDGEQAPSRRVLTDIARELAESLEMEVALETREFEPGRGVTVALRIGSGKGGHALVVGDFTGPTSAGLVGRTQRAALLARGLMIEGAAPRLRAEESSIVMLLGSTGGAADSKAAGCSFDANFPADWGAAYRRDAVSAGPYPCFRADVASVVDWVASERGCFGVLDLGAGAGGHGDTVPAGSLEAYCASEARIAHVATPMGQARSAPLGSASLRSPVRGLGQLFIARTHLVIVGERVRRVAPDAWVVELDAEVRGSGASDPANFAIELALEGDGGAAGSWIGAAESRQGGDGADVIVLNQGRGELGPLAPGDSRRISIFIKAAGADALPASLSLALCAPRCRTNRQSVALN